MKQLIYLYHSLEFLLVAETRAKCRPPSSSMRLTLTLFGYNMKDFLSAVSTVLLFSFSIALFMPSRKASRFSTRFIIAVWWLCAGRSYVRWCYVPCTKPSSIFIAFCTLTSSSSSSLFSDSSSTPKTVSSITPVVSHTISVPSYEPVKRRPRVA